MLSGFYTILLFPAAVVGVINVIYGLGKLGDYAPAYVESICLIRLHFTCRVFQYEKFPVSILKFFIYNFIFLEI